MTIFNPDKPLYVYLQRPDNGQWVVVGRYQQQQGVGRFRYADSYFDAGLRWSIDPVNLPCIPGQNWVATRYQGLHDVLRDACPDAWGQALLRRKHALPDACPALRFLVLAGNDERWGALALGPSRTPSVAHLASPRLPQLDDLIEELLAVAEHRPPRHASLRRRLFATPSLGGARPKTTILDQDNYWLVKPGLATDSVDAALLEHACLEWGRAAGLDMVESKHHTLRGGQSALRVLRFDRHGERRHMTLSAAALLQLEFPPGSGAASYPRLAEELQRIGAPPDDARELFGRMVFNAVIGNDDDHPRNHAVLYRHEQNRWRLAPAFDVVPNPHEQPTRLAMQLTTGSHDIGRASLLSDWLRFGFASREQASLYLMQLLERINAGFEQIKPLLNQELAGLLQTRLSLNHALLQGD